MSCLGYGPSQWAARPDYSIAMDEFMQTGNADCGGNNPDVSMEIMPSPWNRPKLVPADSWKIISLPDRL